MSAELRYENWKIITDYPEYAVSNYGRIRNNKTEYITILPDINANGYARLRLVRNGKIIRKFIHRLVAEMFMENPLQKPIVDHIDGNNKNNRLDNLRWATHSENMLNTKVRKDKKHTTLRNIIKNGKHYRWKICISGQIHTSKNFKDEQTAYADFLQRCGNLSSYVRTYKLNLDL